MLGQLTVGHQPGQVDDAGDSCPLAGRSHPFGGVTVLAGKVLGPHRVHQVDDHVDSLDGPGNLLLVIDVQLAGLDLAVPRIVVSP